MPVPKVKVRKKPQNKRCEKGFPCKTTCISRTKNCLAPLNGQAATVTLWLAHQEEMLAITNRKRQKAGLTPARMTEYGYITAERTKLPQQEAAKVEKVSPSPSPSKPTATTRDQLVAEENRLGKELDAILNKYPGRRTDEQKTEIKAKESEYFAASRALRNFNGGKAVESPTVAEVKPIIGAEVKSAIAVSQTSKPLSSTPSDLTTEEFAKLNYKKIVDRLIGDLEDELKGSQKGITKEYRLSVNKDIAALKSISSFEDVAPVLSKIGYDNLNKIAFSDHLDAIRSKEIPKSLKDVMADGGDINKEILARRNNSTSQASAIAVPSKTETVGTVLKVGAKQVDLPKPLSSYSNLNLSHDPSLGWQVTDKDGDVLRQPKTNGQVNSHRFKERSQAENFAKTVMAKVDRAIAKQERAKAVPKSSVKEEKAIAALEDLAKIRVDNTPKTTGGNSDTQPRGLDEFLNSTTVAFVGIGFNKLNNGIRSGEQLKAIEKLMPVIEKSKAFISNPVGQAMSKDGVQLSNGAFVVPSRLNATQKEALKKYQAEIKASEQAFDRRSRIFTDQVMAPEFKNAKISEAQKVELAQSVGRVALEETDVEKYIKPSTTNPPFTPKPEMSFEDKITKAWEPYVESAKKALPSGKRGKIDRGAATLYGDYAIGSDSSGKWKVTHGALGIATKLPSKESAQVLVHAMTETFGKKTFDQLAKESGLSANDFYSDHWRPTIDSLDEAVRSRDADKIKAIAKSYVPPKAKPEPEKVAQKPEVVPPVAKVDDKEFYQPTAKEFGDRLTVKPEDFKGNTIYLGVAPNSDGYEYSYRDKEWIKSKYGDVSYGNEYRIVKDGAYIAIESRPFVYKKDGNPLGDRLNEGDWKSQYGRQNIEWNQEGTIDKIARFGITEKPHPLVANAVANKEKRQAEQAQREKEARIESDKKQEKETAWAAIKKEMVAALPKPKKNQSVSWQNKKGETVTGTADLYGENYAITKFKGKFSVDDVKSGHTSYASGLTATDAKDLLGILWKERGDKPITMKDGKADIPEGILQIASDYAFGRVKSIPDRYAKEVEDRVSSVNSQKAQAMQSNLFGGLDEIPVDKKREDAIAIQSSVESTKKLDAVNKFRPYVKPKKDNISDKEMEQRIKESNDYFQSIARGGKPGRPTWLDKQAASVDTGRSIAGVGLTPTTKGFVAEQLFKLSAFDFPSAKDYEGDPPKVTVRTPGGGQYQIYKTKEAIATFLDAIGLSPKKGETLFDALKRNSEIVQNFSEPTLSPCDRHLLLLATTAANRIMSYPESLRQGIVNRLRGQLV